MTSRLPKSKYCAPLMEVIEKAIEDSGISLENMMIKICIADTEGAGARLKTYAPSGPYTQARIDRIKSMEARLFEISQTDSWTISDKIFLPNNFEETLKREIK
jgi:hypothetical protein